MLFSQQKTYILKPQDPAPVGGMAGVSFSGGSTSGAPERATRGDLAQLHDATKKTVDGIVNVLRQPLPTPQQYICLDPAGNMTAWIGDIVIGQNAYVGGGFSNVWIGPNADPTTAPFFSNGTQVIIGKNGYVSVQNAAGVEKGFIGYRSGGTPRAITSISNTTPPVVTMGAATPYFTGDTVNIAGNSVSAYNGDQIITVIDSTHFSLNGKVASGVGAGGTSTRFFAGIWAQTAAFSGTGFSDATIKAQADGTVIIGNSTTNITVSPSGAVTITGVGLTLVNGTKSIVLDPTVPDIVLHDSATAYTMTLNTTTGIVTTNGSKTITWNSSAPNITLADASVPATLVLDPTNGSTFTAHGVTTAISNAAGFGPSGTLIGGVTVTDGAGSQFAIVPGGFQLAGNPTGVTQPGLFPGGASGYFFACDNIGGTNFTMGNIQIVQVLAGTATGGGATLPANPVGFFVVKDLGGTFRKIPAYNV
jgi:hypothetical protein